MRVVSIGLDGRVGDLEHAGHALSWVREMAGLVDEYVEIAESPDGQTHGPIALAPNATAWLLAGSPATYPFRAARFAAGLHAQRPFDVISTEDPVRSGLAGALLARRGGLPLNIENHSFHINEPVWLNEKPHHRIYNRIAIWVCRRADSIRNYSAGQNQALLDIGVEARRIHVVPIVAPDLQPLDEVEARRSIGLGSEPLVLCAGRMVAYKNIPVLLRAFQGLPRSLGARLLLVGSGPAKESWQKLASSLGLENRVIWRDAVPWETMVAYYSAANVFAAPALHETGPRTVLEALLCSCPVVITPEMGVVRSGICSNRETALVVGPEDVEGWSHALRTLIMDRELGRRLSEAGRARIGPEISYSALARNVVDVLRDTIELHKSRRC